VTLSLENKVVGGFIAAFAAMLLIGGLTVREAKRTAETFRWVDHTHEVLYLIENIQVDLLNMQTATRGFILTGQENFLGPYDLGAGVVDADLRRLHELTRDNPRQLQEYDRLEASAARTREIMRRLITARRTDAGNTAARDRDLAAGRDAMDAVRTAAARMERIERSLLEERSLAAQDLAQRMPFIVLATAVLGAGLIAVAGGLLHRDFRLRRQAEDEIRQLNLHLRAQNSRLEAVNAELEAFSYSVSHDLRAPLRHMSGFASLLERHAGGQFDDKARHYLATITKAARQMGTLIDDLLAFSRLGRSPVNLQAVDHAALVAELIREGRLDAPPVRWEIGPLPTSRGDATLLRQVWSNLLGNAVKYSRKTPEPLIAVSAQRDETALETVFSVRDNGVGFDPKYAAKLFQVFSRLHSDAEFEGTGIGLALVRRIVARHGGRTWAESEPGRGATFHFSLPDQPIA
jgi:signal transduction histidine kinase